MSPHRQPAVRRPGSRLGTAFLLVVTSLAPGCTGDLPGAKRAGQEEDVLAAVQIYLREERGVNPDAMHMEITDLAIDGDQARVTIRFSSPDTPQDLRFQYLLKRADDLWKVTGSMGQGAHGGGRALPEGHPDLPQDQPPNPQTRPQDTATDVKAH